jgi:hypothetical protein
MALASICELRKTGRRESRISPKGSSGIKLHYITLHCGPDTVVGIATSYGLDGSGIESRWGRDFPHLSRPALGPTQPSVQWIPSFHGVKERQGSDADPSPPSSAVVMKG